MSKLFFIDTTRVLRHVASRTLFRFAWASGTRAAGRAHSLRSCSAVGPCFACCAISNSLTDGCSLPQPDMSLHDATALRKVRDVIDAQDKLHMHLLHLAFEEQDPTLFPLKYDDKYRESTLSAEEHRDLLSVGVEKASSFYKDFVHTCKYIPDTVHRNSVKVYMRLFKSSGEWYVGYTAKSTAYRRHYEDRLESVNLIERNVEGSKLMEHYKRSIFLHDDVTILTIAEVHDIDTAKILEAGLIRHLTKNKELPVDLCLNTDHVPDKDTEDECYFS